LRTFTPTLVVRPSGRDPTVWSAGYSVATLRRGAATHPADATGYGLTGSTR
jgi:hypothetical protein